MSKPFGHGNSLRKFAAHRLPDGIVTEFLLPTPKKSLRAGFL
jgi:hypothetical protein